jgi:non-specific serine/threonine protein kinase
LLFDLGAILFALRGYLNTGDKAVAGALIFVALAEEAEPMLLTPSRELLENLEAEHDNFRTTLSWSLERGGIELGLRLAGALRWFWFARGYLGEGRKWLEELLHEGERTAARIKALLALSWLAHQQGDADVAKAAAEAGLGLGNDLGVEGKLRAELLNVLASAEQVLGDYDRARGLYEETLTLSREAGDKWALAFHLNALGDLYMEQGDDARAEALLEESLSLSQELGDHAHSAIILSNLAISPCTKATRSRQGHWAKSKPRATPSPTEASTSGIPATSTCP